MLAGARHVVCAGGYGSVPDSPLAVVEMINTHAARAVAQVTSKKQSNLLTCVHSVKQKQQV